MFSKMDLTGQATRDSGPCGKPTPRELMEEFDKKDRTYGEDRTTSGQVQKARVLDRHYK